MNYLRDLAVGRYHAVNSPLHRLDPRTKMLCAILLMLGDFLIINLPAMILFFILVSWLFPLARIPWKTFWSNLATFAWFYALTFVIHLFFHPGQELLRIPALGWIITAEGVKAGFLFSIRIAALVSLSALLMALTTPQDLADGLERMLRPLARFKVPVAEGALLISIALRFVPVILEEAEKIRLAQISRGANLDSGRWPRIQKYLPMMIPLFAGALRRADNLALALEARAYRGGNHRTQLVELRLHLLDIYAFMLCLSAFGLFWIWR